MAASEIRFRVMASAAQVIIIDGTDSDSDSVQRSLQRLEALWSRFIPDSDIGQLNLNSGSPVKVAIDTIVLVETMIEAWRATSGLFNPSILPALVWSGYSASIDDPNQKTCLPEINLGWGLDLDQVSIDRTASTIRLPHGMTLDPGGIGKGLAADLMVRYLLRLGAKGALVNIGGDMSMAGTPPNEEGWVIAIENPFESTSPVSGWPIQDLQEDTYVNVSAGGVATSSTLTRRWSNGHNDLHHLVDPTRGMQSDTDLAAVTVVAPTAWQAEAHATAIMLGGRSGFGSYVDDHQLSAIATVRSGLVLKSKNLSQQSTEVTVS